MLREARTIAAWAVAGAVLGWWWYPVWDAWQVVAGWMIGR